MLKRLQTLLDKVPDKNQVILITEGTNQPPEFGPLFGKYHVSKVNKYPNNLSLYIGDENAPLAVLKASNDEGLHLYGNYAFNNSDADIETFKQLYQDAKKHFSDLGVRINTARTHKIFPGLQECVEEDFFSGLGLDLELLKRLEKTDLPASFLTTTNILGFQKTHPSKQKIKSGELSKQIYESVDFYLVDRFPNQEQEIVPYGSLGALGRGSKIWTVEPGLYVIFEAAPCDDAPWPVNMQVNSDETHSVESVSMLREDIVKHIESNFEIEFFDESDPSHSFHIDLSDLNKLKLNGPEEQIQKISDK